MDGGYFLEKKNNNDDVFVGCWLVCAKAKKTSYGRNSKVGFAQAGTTVLRTIIVDYCGIF